MRNFVSGNGGKVRNRGCRALGFFFFCREFPHVHQVIHINEIQTLATASGCKQLYM